MFICSLVFYCMIFYFIILYYEYFYLLLYNVEICLVNDINIDFIYVEDS